jgi:hypothetical protein
MNEVDRLSNSGLYPILPIGDKRNPKGEAGHKPTGDPKEKITTKDETKAKDNEPPSDDSSGPPKSLIDEYA